MIIQLKLKENIKHLILLLVIIMAFFPLYLMVNISLKDNSQFAHNPWLPEVPFHWDNYIIGWHYVGQGIFNTTFVAFIGTFLSVAIALPGAFFFARFKVPLSGVLFYVFIILMLYPGIANMVPTFKLMASLGLYNSHWSLIVLTVAGSQAFLIFVLRAFIEDLPRDLFDAAEIDGCSLLRQIWHIVVPLTLPILGVLCVLKIIAIWNDFVGPLILLRDSQKQLLAVSLLLLEGEYVKHWGELMAGYTIASIPLIIIFILAMRLFVRGLCEGAIKG
jgi:ABC-type glycerol-3-phosphate transport system permease component